MKRAGHTIHVALWLVALLVVSGVHAAPLAQGRWPGAVAADPVIRFSPSSITVEPGATFVIDVVVDNVEDLGAFEFDLEFNPVVVNAQGAAVGPFLGSTGNSVVPVGPAIDNVQGTLSFGGFTLPPRPAAGPDGTGTVAQITLLAVAPGSSTALIFADAQLTDTEVNVVVPLTLSGSVTVSSAGATPTATVAGSPTLTRTSTPTEIPSSTWTPTLTATVAPSPTPTMTVAPTLTHTPVVPTATVTEQATPTVSPTPTSTAVATPTVTLTPTVQVRIYLPVVLRRWP